jgi:hypothetical protein
LILISTLALENCINHLILLSFLIKENFFLPLL